MLKLFLRNIKKGFATNSSSYHSTMIFTKEEYEKWKKGEHVASADYTYAKLNGDDTDDDEYSYFYIETTAERTINGQDIVAVTYCEDN